MLLMLILQFLPVLLILMWLILLPATATAVCVAVDNIIVVDLSSVGIDGFNKLDVLINVAAVSGTSTASTEGAVDISVAVCCCF